MNESPENASSKSREIRIDKGISATKINLLMEFSLPAMYYWDRLLNASLANVKFSLSKHTNST
jgi:hypothetical protein